MKYKYMEIIEKSRTIESLPSLKSIYKKVNKKVTEGEYSSDELLAEIRRSLMAPR